MSESMNIGNLGFANVSSSSVVENRDSSVTSVTQNTDVQPQQPQQQTLQKPDLMAGVKEAQEAKAKEEQEAIKDFKNTTVKKTHEEQDADNFSQIDFGPLKKYLDDDDVTDISYSNNGQLWLKSLSRGVYRADQQDVDNALIEKIAFQCSNIMGKTFNMAHPFLDSESAELRMNFVHDSIARNGIAVVFRKTPAKIRLEKQKLLNERYIQLSIHDFLINCVKGHCNIIVCGETGSGKTELVKYLASHTAENEKIITIEDTLELHLDRIFPHRDIVAMKTNNIASYSDVLVTCMRQNPIWILLSEVRSAEAVTAVRNSISSGHYILSTIHADKAESIPHRMYSLLESNIDVEQFLKTIYRYVQIGVFVRGRYKAEEQRFVREIAGVCEFFVTDDTNEPKFNNIYLKTVGGEESYQEPTKYIKNYLEGQGVDITNLFGEKLSSLAAANEANGIESDVKESNGETVHIPGKTQSPSAEQKDKVEENKVEQVDTNSMKKQEQINNPASEVQGMSQGPANLPTDTPVEVNPNQTIVHEDIVPQEINIPAIMPQQIEQVSAQPAMPQQQIAPQQINIPTIMPQQIEQVSAQPAIPQQQIEQQAGIQEMPVQQQIIPQKINIPAIMPQVDVQTNLQSQAAPQPITIQPAAASQPQEQTQVQAQPMKNESKFFSGLL